MRGICAVTVIDCWTVLLMGRRRFVRGWFQVCGVVGAAICLVRGSLDVKMGNWVEVVELVG